MRRIILPLSLLLVIAMCSCTGSDRWKLAAEIENAIVKTSFPADTFNIADFGAVAGDTSFLNTEAIEAAIIKCSNEGGGVVLVPEGTWTTGPVTLLSNVNLHISENAILLFSTRL